MDKRARVMIDSLLKHEGGWSGDKSDLGNAGGLDTYRGITRKNYPNWSGWPIVDANKPLRWNQVIRDSKLEDLVREFYYKNYYLKNKVDRINNPLVAYHLLDHCVNAGARNGIKILQRSINAVLNMNISVDGVIGPQTVGLANHEKAQEIGLRMDAERKAYYQRIVSARPANSKYLKGWTNRVTTATRQFRNYTDGSIVTSVILGKNTNPLREIVNGTILGGLSNIFESFFGGLIKKK